MVERLALEALGVSKRYGDREALGGVDLIARPGQLHGLLGPNGAGKTTLLRILLGLVRPDTGTISLLGAPLDTGRGLAEGIAGFVEMPGFYPYLSGRDNLRLLERLDAGGAAPRISTSGSVLEQVGLAAHADRNVAGYSAGMRQRLALAAALLRAPRLLLLDEPTNALDPAGARDIRALLAGLAAQGTAVVLSSHDMTEIEALCAVVTVLHEGRVVVAGAVAELRRRAPADVYAVHTSSDAAAIRLAAGHSGVRVTVPPEGTGFGLSAGLDALDTFVLALGQAGIAVRSLERRARSLEAMFLQLTADARGTEPADRRTAS